MTISKSPADLIRSETASSQASTQLVLVENGIVVVPDAAALLNGSFARLGDDLLIISPDGARFLVQNFFTTEPIPNLTDGNGILVNGAVVARVAQRPDPIEYAQDGEGEVTEAIGIVQTIEGEVTVERLDGSIVTLQVGDAVYMGDLIITGEGASVGLVFLDETTFALGEDGELILDELIYDPASDTGSATFTLLAGAASVISGSIAKTGADAMKLDTPVATIGIRGTKVLATYDPVTGQITIVNRPELTAAGLTQVGEISLTLPDGTPIGTINNTNGGWQFSAGETPTAVTFTEADVQQIGGGVDALVQNIVTQNNNGNTQDNEGDQDDTVPNNNDGTDTPSTDDNTAGTADATVDTTTTTDATTGETTTTTTTTATTTQTGAITNTGLTTTTTGTTTTTTTTTTNNNNNNDPADTVTPSNVSVALLSSIISDEPGSSFGNAVFQITRGGNTQIAVTVNYTTASSSAAAGSDYTATAGSVTFAPGETTATITVPILADGTGLSTESAETFFLQISTNDANVVLTNTAASAVIAADTLPELSIAVVGDAAVSDTEGATVTLEVTRTGNLNTESSVIVALNNSSSAINNEDFTYTPDIVEFGVGEATKTITVTILPDAFGDALEPEETITFAMVNAVNAEFTGGEVTVTILADAEPPVVSVTADVTSVDEGGAIVLTFTRTGNTEVAAGVQYTLSGDGITAADFTDGALSGGVSFAAGETTKTVTIGIAQDGVDEVTESLTVEILGDAGTNIAEPTSATVTINNVDASPSVTISNGTGSEADGSVVLTVTLSEAVDNPTFVFYSTADGSAIAGSDYTAVTNGVVTIPAGQTSATFTVTILGNEVQEGAETFFVEIVSTGDGVDVGTPGTGTVTITADAPAAPTENPVAFGTTFGNDYIQFDSYDDADDHILSNGTVTVTSHTLEAWFRSGETSGIDPIIAIDGGDTGPFTRAYLENGVLTVEVKDGSGNVIKVTSAETVNDQDWHHVAYTFNASTNTLKLFVDGEEVTTTDAGSSGTLNFTITDQVYIGATNDGSSGFDFFTGGIDQPRVWDAVRSASDILSSAVTGVTGSEANLLLAYDFNDFNGSTVANLVSGGTALDGTAFGDPVGITTSPALDFTGTGKVQTGIEELDGSFTISAWIAVDNGATGTQTILAKHTSPGSSFDVGEFMLSVSSSGALQFTMGFGGGQTTVTGNALLKQGSWYHVTATYNASGDAMQLFVDGVSVGTGTLGGTRQTGVNEIVIGEAVLNSGTDGFDGAIRDVAIFNTVLGSTPIGDLPANGPDITSDFLVAYYPFTEGAGSIIHDAAGRHEGIVVGATEWLFDSPPIGDTAATTVTTLEDVPVEFFIPALDPDGDTDAITFTGTSSQGTVSAGSEGLVFSPNENFNGSATVNVTITDEAGGTATQTITVSVGAVEDAPEFSGDATLASINENDTNPPGETVTNLFSSLYSDAEGDSFTGVAVVGNAANSSTEGKWQFSTDSGSNWDDIGSASFGSSVLLSASTEVRFLPVSGFTGDPTPLQVLAINSDYSGSFSFGGGEPSLVIFDTSNSGGTSAFAEEDVDIDTTVTEVNDPPVPFAGNSIEFDGTGDFVSIGPSSDLVGGGSNFTVSAWIKPDGVSGFQDIVTHDTTNSLDGFSFGLNGSELYATANQGTTATTSGAGIAAGVWTHVAVTVSGTTATFYINGVSAGTGSFSGGAGDNSDDEVHFGVGFDGLIDDIVWWNTALNSGNISTVYTGQLDGGVLPGNVVGQWGFDDGGGSITVDFADPDQNGDLNGDAVFSNESAPHQPNSPLELYSSEDQQMTIQLGGTDPEGDSLTITISAVPFVGALYQTPDGSSLGAVIGDGDTVTNANGLVIYVPAADDDGADTDVFSFSIDDGTNTPVTQQVDISLQSVDDDAVIDATDTPIAFNDSDPAVILDAAATVTDVDDFELDTEDLGGSLTITVTSSNTADDRLTIKNVGTSAGQIGTTGSNVTYGGVTIGTFTGGTGLAALVITLNASASLAAVEELAQNIEFQNVGTGETGSKTIEFRLEEADGDSSVSTTDVTVNMNPITGVFFDAGGSIATDWFDAGNWSGDALPISTDDVTISGASFDVDFDDGSNGTTTINDLTLSSSADLDIQDDTLITNGSVNIASGSVLSVNGGATFTVNGTATNAGTLTVGAVSTTGTVDGSGILDNTGTLNGLHGSIEINTFNNNGDFVVANTTSSAFTVSSTNFTNQSGGTITIIGGPPVDGYLEINATTLINDGLIELTDSGGAGEARLFTNEGSVTNNGTIHVIASSGGDRFMSAIISNSGTIDIDTDTTFTRSTVNESGGVFDVAASTEVSFTTGSLTANGGTFTFGSGAGLLFINNQELSVTAATTIGTNGTITLGNASGSNGAITNGGTLTIEGVLIAYGGEITNTTIHDANGAGTVEIRETGTDAFDISGTFINRNGNFSVIGANSNDAELDISGSFTNEDSGVFILTNEASGLDALVSTSAGGVITNESGGIIRTSVGAGGGTRTFDADINNAGTLDIDFDTIFTGTGSVLTNSSGGVIDFAVSTKLIVNGSGVVSFDGGTIVAGSGAKIEVSGGGALDIAAATTFVANLEVELGQPGDAGNITGSGALTNDGTIFAIEGSIAAPLTNNNAVTVTENGLAFDFDGALTNASGGTLSVFGSTFDGHLDLNASSSNAGLIQLNSDSASSTARLDVDTGTLSVTGTGQIQTLGDTTLSRIITGDVDFSGTSTFNLDVDTEFTGSSTNISFGSGTMLDMAASTKLVLDSSAILDMNGGTIVAASGAKIEVGGGAAIALSAATTIEADLEVELGQPASAGNITGAGALTNDGTIFAIEGSIAPAITNNNVLTVTENGLAFDFNGALTNASGGTLSVFGSTFDGHLDLNASSTNAGLIQLNSDSASSTALLDVDTGTLSVTGTGSIQTLGTTGENRVVTGDVDFSGTSTFNLDVDTEFTGSGTNVSFASGTMLDMANGTKLILDSSAVLDMNGGTIAADSDGKIEVGGNAAIALSSATTFEEDLEVELGQPSSAGNITGAGVLTNDGTIFAIEGSIAPAITNNNILTVTENGLAFDFNGALTNAASGTLSVFGSTFDGHLDLNASSTNAGLIQLNSDSATSTARLDVDTGTLGVTGSIQTLGTTGENRIVTGDVDFTGSGTFNLDVDTEFTGSSTNVSFASGTMLDMAASTKLVLDSSAVLDMNGGTIVAASGAKIEVGGGASIALTSATTFEADLEVELGQPSSAGNITGAGVLTNDGTIFAIEGSIAQAITNNNVISVTENGLAFDFNGALTNAGTLNVAGSTFNGHLDLEAGGSNSDTINLTSDSASTTAQLDITGTLINTGLINATGTAGVDRVLSGNITNNNGADISVDVDTTYSSGTITNNSGGDVLVLSGATLTIASGATLNTVSGGFVVADAGTLTVDGAISNASGGTMQFSGTGSTNSIFDLNVNFTNAGDVAFGSDSTSATSSLDIQSGATLTNTGTIDFTGTAGTDRTIVGSGTLDNDNIVNIDADTTLSAGTVDNDGDFNVADGVTFTTTGASVLDNTGGTITLGDGAILTFGNDFDLGAGTLAVDTPSSSTGTIQANSGSGLTYDTTGSITSDINFDFNTGNNGLGGSGDLTINGDVFINADTSFGISTLLLDTTSTTFIAAGATWSIGGGAGVTVDGSITTTSTSTISIGSSSDDGLAVFDMTTAFINAGTFEVDSADSGGATEVTMVGFTNNNILNLDGGNPGSSVTFTADLLNNGTISTDGAVDIETASILTFDNSGTFNVGTGSVTDVIGVTFENNDTVNINGGALLVDSGNGSFDNLTTLTMDGTTGAASLTVADIFNDFVINLAGSTNGVTVSTNVATIVNDGVVNVTSGTVTFELTDPFANQSIGAFNIDTGASAVVNGAAFANAGTFTVDGGSYSSSDGSDFSNSDTVIMDALMGAVSFTGVGTLTNTGTFDVAADTNGATISVDTLTNDGGMTFLDGTTSLTVSTAMTNDTGGGFIVGFAATVDFTGANFVNDGSATIDGILNTNGFDFINNGFLDGTGTIDLTDSGGDGTYTNNGDDSGFFGTINPGASPGEFTILGNAKFGEMSTTEIELAGTKYEDHDHFNVSGLMTLGGRLNVISYEGFLPSAGDSFSVFEWGTREGMFHEAEGLVFTETGVALDTVFGDNGLTLTARTITDQGDDSAEIFGGSLMDDVIAAQGGDDSLAGQAGDDLLIGGDGDDVLSGGSGDDRLIGGYGTDTADYADAASGVTVNLENGEGLDGEGGIDTLISIENVIGSDYDDVITGNSRDNVFIGGQGSDVFIGGGGADSFVLNAANEGGDLIQDFTSGEDSIVLGSAFGFDEGTAQDGVNFSVIGEVYDGSNAGNNDAHAAGDASLIYSEADNALVYDENGKDDDGYSVVATLQPGAGIVADDVHFAA